MKPKALIATLAAIAMVSLVACNSDEPSQESQGTEVATTLHDYRIETSVGSVPAGKVTFAIENVGATEHEMVVIQTDVAIADMAVEGHETNEEAPGMNPIGEVEDVQPGESTTLVLTLEPGRYVLLCNLPKHFERGMATEFQVT
jgi:uncharacterized cupredoxin-like copper-binding protein